jgi:serine/threonine-protein kinase
MSAAAAQVHSLGSYEIVRKLGSGGMADVFLARQHMAADVERAVVVKAILPSLAEDDRFVQMFLREARIAAHLQHPNIVAIHDVSVIESRPCICMEFLRGRDLWYVIKRMLDREEPIAARATAAVIAQAATGLDYAHKRRDERGRKLDLVHRDISPHNLFLTRDGLVKVLDFGIAKSRYSQQKTQEGVIRGKLPYMAPEQARNLGIDGRADQFALGVILWEMLTSRRLFARDDPFHTLTDLFHKEVKAPSSIVDGVPRDLDRIALRALARDPEQRYPSCEAMAADLRAWLGTVQAPGEGVIVTELLETAIPSEEDEALYGMPFEHSAIDVALPGVRPFEHGTGSAQLPVAPIPAAPTVIRELAPLPTVTGAQSTPASVLQQPARTALPRPVLIGGAVAAAVVIGIIAAVAIGGGDGEPADGVARSLEARLAAPAVVPGQPAVPMPPITHRGSPAASPPPPPAAIPSTPPPPQPVEVRFLGVPPGVTLEIDGVVLEGTTHRTESSDAVRHVRALRAGRELWRYDAIFQRTTDVTLPEFPGLEPDPIVIPVPARPVRPTTPTPTKRPTKRLGNDIDRGYP